VTSVVLVHRDAGWLQHHLPGTSRAQTAVDQIIGLPVLGHLIRKSIGKSRI
jgi:hypothetical protein